MIIHAMKARRKATKNTQVATDINRYIRPKWRGNKQHGTMTIKLTNKKSIEVVS